VTKTEIEEYFEVIEWFGILYNKGEAVEEVVKRMFHTYPNTSLKLLKQGFFMAIALRN
jgi:hypothetical protein